MVFAWLEEQWDNPGLTELYLMQIACEVRRVLHKDPNKVKLDDFKLKFNKPKPLSRKEAARQAKATWFAITRHQGNPDDGSRNG